MRVCREPRRTTKAFAGRADGYAQLVKGPGAELALAAARQPQEMYMASTVPNLTLFSVKTSDKHDSLALRRGNNVICKEAHLSELPNLTCPFCMFVLGDHNSTLLGGTKSPRGEIAACQQNHRQRPRLLLICVRVRSLQAVQASPARACPDSLVRAGSTASVGSPAPGRGEPKHQGEGRFDCFVRRGACQKCKSGCGLVGLHFPANVRDKMESSQHLRLRNQASFPQIFLTTGSHRQLLTY